MHDIGTLGSDSLADPAGINNNTQIVGGSCDDSGNCRGFLSENNKMNDLNDLIDPDSPYYLLYALNINDAGEIVGFAVVKKTGEVHAYVAHPVRGKSGNTSAQPAVQQTNESRHVAVPESLRRLMRQRLPNLTVGSLPR
jgi:probable HAF family extracellular repeat protein